MEIIGFYKYFKWKIQEYNKENLADIYLTTDSKFQGLLTDILVIVLLFIFAFFIIKKNEKKEARKKKLENRLQIEDEKEIIPTDQQEKREGNKEISAESLVNNILKYTIEKSFILSVFILFCCSITKFDLIHAIYFFLFIFLVSFNEKHFKSIWYITLLTNQLIIIFLYFWNIFAVNYFNLEEEVNPSKKNIFSILGLKIETTEIFFVSYWEHIILALWGLFQHFLFSSKYMKKKREIVHNMTELSVISEEEECIRNLYRFPDSAKFSIFCFTYFLLLIMSFIRPLSFQGLVFLFFMMLILFAQLFLIREEKSRLLNFLIGCVIFIAIIIITFKYLINFPFVMNYFKELFYLIYYRNFSKNPTTRIDGIIDPSHNMLFKKDFIKSNNLEDYGLDQENILYKLIFNCILIIFLKIIICYDDCVERVDSNKSVLTKNKSDVKLENSEKMFIYLKVIFFQIIYLHSSKILIAISAIIALSLASMIGGLILVILFICLIEGKNNNWKYAFFPLFYLSMITLTFIYLCNLKLFRKWMTKDYEWLGVYNPNSSEELFSQVFPFLLIMLFSYMARISQKYKDFYKDKSNSFETENCISTANQKIYNNTEDQSNEDDNLEFNLSQVSVKHDVEMEGNVIETMSHFWNNVDYILYIYGFYIILFVILIVSFIKVNIVSIVYITFVGLQSFNVYFRTDYMTDHERNNVDFKSIKRNWNIFSIFILLFSLCQYLNLIWFPPSWKIAKPWESFSFFCSKEGRKMYSTNIHYKNISDYEYCVSNWKAWFNIDNIESRDIFNNFICAFLILLCQKYFTHQNLFKRPEFDITKAKDFTIAENRQNRDLVHYILFVYFKKIILVYIIFISLIYSYINTNIIYGGYLFFSFFLLFKDGKLDKEKNKLWKFVQYYNFIVLIAIMYT